METGFIKIRSVYDSDWVDRENSYHYSNTVARYSHIKSGVKFLLETKFDSVWYFIGHGVFGEVTEAEGEDENKTYYRAYYDKLTKFDPTPNPLAKRITHELGFAGPMGYIQASILSISEESFNLAVRILEQDTYQKSSFSQDTVNWSCFQLWLASKFNRISDSIEKSEATTLRKFRQSFPYLTGESDTDRSRTTIQLPTTEWVNEDSIKDTWQPRKWGCVKTQDLMNKGICELECEYSPAKELAKSCKDGYGAIWFRDSRKAKFSPIYLDVLVNQIVQEKIDYEEFCRYITNRAGQTSPETKEWVKETFHLTQNELNRLFDLQDQETSLIELSELSNLGKSIIQNLDDKSQVILYGPPGTGKTFIAQQVANHIVHPAGNENITSIQFHPSYTYQDFVEGLFPESEDGQIIYDFRPGHFKRLCNLAIDHPGQKYCLIIDEINRANLPKVMGELFYSLEYRGEEHSVRLSTSPEEEFHIPDNVYIVGTMNTADRSLADIDIALRRRFRFIEIPPDVKVLENYYANEDNRERVDQITKLFEIVNRKLLERLGNRDMLIGHSYFMLSSLEDESIKNFLFYELIPLIQDYFYQDRREVSAILGDYIFEDPETLLLKIARNFDLDTYLQSF